ncbi:hypothetical protein N1851_012929 [Merluccius polli]|uniref:Uncharacterized protein n=1 Tax=Merluccius polli TaxID=89951 RepID=A0AA47MVR5_MERPO|nr:hypothetical protein N1851_012929 [Merluccius polli]
MGRSCGLTSGATPHQVLVQAFYDVHPSSSKTCPAGAWSIHQPLSPLCQRKGTLEHILSCCPKALGDADTADGTTRCSRPSQRSSTVPSPTATKQTISFIRAGEKPRATPKATSAQDWQLAVDLDRQLKLPQHVTKTTLRPYTVLVSEATSVVMPELTVPWEDRMAEL